MNDRRTHIFVAVVYLAVMTAVVYFGFDARADAGCDLAFVAVLVANVLLGVLVPRWWAFALPIVLVLISIPAGYPHPDSGEERQEIVGPTWFWMAVYVPIFWILIGGGRFGRWAVEKLRARSPRSAR